MRNDKEFKNADSAESKYRHSLREEISSLGVAIESVQTSLKEGPLKEKDLIVSIANLLRLHKAGSSRFMCCWRCRTKASRAITPPTARTIARNCLSI
jgi:hypothetical protein